MEKRKIILIVVVIAILALTCLISKSHNNSQQVEDYKPSTEYEILAYNAFIDRFGKREDMQVTDISTSETSYDKIKNNSYDEYSKINESDYTEFLDVEVEYFLDENTGNLMTGRNAHSYYLGLNNNGKYVVLGESLLG